MGGVWHSEERAVLTYLGGVPSQAKRYRRQRATGPDVI